LRSRAGGFQEQSFDANTTVPLVFDKSSQKGGRGEETLVNYP
ncbi:hypothetical protein LEMLEM_LOCUS1900, partial [Lemmus lemmus]